MDTDENAQEPRSGVSDDETPEQPAEPGKIWSGTEPLATVVPEPASDDPDKPEPEEPGRVSDPPSQA